MIEISELIVKLLSIRVKKEDAIRKQLYEPVVEGRDKERVIMYEPCKLLPDDSKLGNADNYESSSAHTARQLIIANYLSHILGYDVNETKTITLLRDFKFKLILEKDGIVREN